MTNNYFTNPFSEEIWETTHKHHSDQTVEDTWRRVAKNIASAETTTTSKEYWEDKFYELLYDFKGVPGGRILSNAGTGWENTTYFNCFVGPVPEYDADSLTGIYESLTNQAHTLKSEGGYGMSFNFIRPRGSFIHGVGVESPGAVQFMEIYDKSSEIVTAGSGLARKNSKAKGKIRKGAQMGSMSVYHPDIIEFITAKQTPGRLAKFNVSVEIPDVFMAKLKAVESMRSMGADPKKIEEADMWALVYPDTSCREYKSEWQGSFEKWIDKRLPLRIYEKTTVTHIWNLIMESTYSRNEPGVLFLDRANKLNPAWAVEDIISTNPCGEIPLPPSGICCLFTHNLVKYVKPDLSGFDLESLAAAVKVSVRFLDNVNTVSDAPLEGYRWSKEHKRRIGCGIMGWGSALLMLRVRFGSKRASEIKEELMSTFARSAYEASIDLAVEKGMYSVCKPDTVASSEFVSRLGLSDEYMYKLRTTGIRNSALLSCQPNGNTSIEAGLVSGGIEPVFMFEYIRTSILSYTPEEIKEFTPAYFQGEFEETSLFKFAKEGDETILRAIGPETGTVYKIDKNRGLTKETLCEDYGVRELKLKGLWDESADWAVTSQSLSAEDHVNDLAEFCKYLDNSASKTVNLPQTYEYEDFKKLYLYAYDTGYIKGITTYRAGTMTSVLAAKDERDSSPEDEEIILSDIKLPDTLPSTLKTLRSESRKWYLTLVMNEAQTRPIALFVHTNSAEKNVTTNDALERLLQLAEAKGIPEQHIESVLKKVGGDPNTTKICRFISLCLRHGVLIKNVVNTLNQVDCLAGSFVFHIRKFLASYIKDGEKVDGEVCSECESKNSIIYQEGCKICSVCGASKCG